jgi:acetyl-CoA synthetase
MTDKKLSGEVYYPSDKIINNSNIKNWDEVNDYATNNYEAFWEDRANELTWFKKWDKVLDD